jgi:DNA-binding Lrp family transcriptional regulator
MLELDSTDRKILRELQRNGRISIAALSDIVGLTATPCQRRMREMEKSGVIKSFTCVIDPTFVGLEIEALVHVSLEKHAAFAIAEFTTELKKIPNVVQCYSLTGQYDALLRVLAPSIASFEHLLMTRLAKLPGVANLNSNIVLNRLIDRPAVPL